MFEFVVLLSTEVVGRLSRLNDDDVLDPDAELAVFVVSRFYGIKISGDRNIRALSTHR